METTYVHVPALAVRFVRMELKTERSENCTFVLEFAQVQYRVFEYRVVTRYEIVIHHHDVWCL